MTVERLLLLIKETGDETTRTTFEHGFNRLLVFLEKPNALHPTGKGAATLRLWQKIKMYTNMIGGNHGGGETSNTGSEDHTPETGASALRVA